ncbi:hypothetical protein ACFU76_25660 [Streptomyces sp. NPDC057539]|uniref:GHMP family kinase ATP-binding protein n=1 Tax=Streptomyces sp. NPDC057539 TaxID=3346159 RepID=UPI0036B18A3C
MSAPDGERIVVASTPLRISLGGGGTDLPFYADRFGGDMLSVAISLRSTVTARRGRVDGRIRFTHDETSLAREATGLHSPYVAHALAITGFTGSCEITSSGPVPAGTGLGSSAAFTVSLLAALRRLGGDRSLNGATPELVEQAWSLEAERLGRPVGRHDPYVCGLGGVRRLIIAPDGTTHALVPGISADTLRALEDRLLLYYTGRSRDSAAHLAPRPGGVAERTERLHRIRAIGGAVLTALENGDIDRVPVLLREHNEIKQRASRSDDDFGLGTALKHGALAGKLVGAGGGGFLLAFAEPDRRDELDAAMSAVAMPRVPFRFSRGGTAITDISYDTEEILV